MGEIGFEKAYVGLLAEEKKLFTPDFARLNSMSKVESLLKHEGRFAMIRPSLNAQFSKGGLYLGCEFNGQLVLGKLKISPHLNRSELWIASEEE